MNFIIRPFSVSKKRLFYATSLLILVVSLCTSIALPLVNSASAKANKDMSIEEQAKSFAYVHALSSCLQTSTILGGWTGTSTTVPTLNGSDPYGIGNTQEAVVEKCCL